MKFSFFSVISCFFLCKRLISYISNKGKKTFYSFLYPEIFISFYFGYFVFFLLPKRCISCISNNRKKKFNNLCIRKFSFFSVILCSFLCKILISCISNNGKKTFYSFLYPKIFSFFRVFRVLSCSKKESFLV